MQDWERENIDFLDIIEIMAFIIQLMDYDLTLRQTSNDDLMAEMRKQDSIYLQKIIEQNEKILALLDKCGLKNNLKNNLKRPE